MFKTKRKPSVKTLYQSFYFHLALAFGLCLVMPHPVLILVAWILVLFGVALGKLVRDIEFTKQQDLADRVGYLQIEQSEDRSLDENYELLSGEIRRLEHKR